ncbi:MULTISPECIES: hypothetical protein [Haloferacaceae]|uniref:HNH endonuclease n=2 Tax=Haloferacaceae TaxID=1644056 RepID=A0ABD6DBC7_9EURY|nr:MULTISPECIES: hypothetical protein [Halorubraceae]
MTGSSQPQTQETMTESTHECGHSTDRDAISLPEVGRICRSCYTPFSLKKWDASLRRTKVHHQTGETTHYNTWLVGVDDFGRAVYHDEKQGRILKVVPKHHRAFRDEVDDDMRILRGYPHPHAAGYGHILNAPDNDVLVAVDSIKTSSRDFSKDDLVGYVTEHASVEGWHAISSPMLDCIRRYNSPRTRHEYEHADEVLNEFADDE